MNAARVAWLFATGVACLLASACARQSPTVPAVIPTESGAATFPVQMVTTILPPLTPTATTVPKAATATVPPAAPATVIPSPGARQISITSVEVIQGSGIFVLGKAGLADGECIQTELVADNQPEPWWPRDTCIQVAAGQWEILVSLGRRGAPLELSRGVQYQIHAWWPKSAQETSIYFPFDMSGPPGG